MSGNDASYFKMLIFLTFFEVLGIWAIAGAVWLHK